MEFKLKYFSCIYIRTVAIDMRGYNLSERPIGTSNYKIANIVEDLRALIEHLSEYEVESAVCFMRYDEGIV